MTTYCKRNQGPKSVLHDFLCLNCAYYSGTEGVITIINPALLQSDPTK